jgi:putative nucleotidyltransferase with HDIG domain
MLNILFFVALTSIVSRYFVSLELYIIPFAILAICMHTFFDSRIAIFVNIITVFLCSFYADNPFDFVILHVLAGTVATYSVRNLSRRGQVIQTAMVVFVTYSAVYFAMSLIQEGSLSSINYTNFGYFAGNAILLLFAYPLIYVYERIFNYMSNVTLIELSDTNHDLLQDLSEKAPGTFQHSLMVASLSQEAARAIDANPLLARVGAYFHDIGKMEDPAYFTENQAANYNPHDHLTPQESAKRVIDHVENGVRLARKFSLPQPVIDFIRMHHGRGQTKYFMNEYAKQHPGEKIDDQLFSYPGPSPMTPETAILMMADAVEAASRSLEEYTDESISKLVEAIVTTQVEEGNFRYAPITFVDVETVKETFKKRLKIIYHSRIAYPSKKEMAENIKKKDE